MVPENSIAARPRSAGEILDDAWRQSFADAAPLLFLSGLFLAPAFAAILWILARGSVESLFWRVALCGATATLVALSGAGSGACQELLLRRSEARRVSVAACLGTALRRGVGHIALRTLVVGFCSLGLYGFVPVLTGINFTSAIFAALIGTGYLVLPAALVWMATATGHAVLASPQRSTDVIREIGQAMRADPGKSAVVVLSRVPLMALACFNLALLVAVGLWTAINLGGFDLARVAAALSLRNPVYDLMLVMISWLLLSPYIEVSNFLLYLDARTRRDGLDLLRRVRRLFPPVRRAVTVLMTAFFCCGVASAGADESWSSAVRAARAEVETIRSEVAAATPYPGGKRWAPRMKAASKRMKTAAGTAGQRHTASWFERTLTGFARADRTAALRVLDDLQQRLMLVEETLPAADAGPNEQQQSLKKDIKSLVNGTDNKADDATPTTEPQHQPPPSRQAEHPVAQGGPEPHGSAAAAGDGSLSESGNSAVWLLLAGIVLALIGVAAVRFWQTLPRTVAKSKRVAVGIPASDSPRPEEQSAPVLWRQAEELARAGRHRDGVRALYLAVLSMLHARRLVRFETARTNGEYVREIRLAPEAPDGLADQFERLTGHFEGIWYGGGNAAAADFQQCRSLAEATQALAHT